LFDEERIGFIVRLNDPDPFPDIESTTEVTMLLHNLATVGALAAFVLTGTGVPSQSGGANVDGQPAKDISADPIYRKFQDLKWEKIIPELGDGSPTTTILHVDPRTHATQLMIRTPKNFHVPRHWHTANETHTVVSGTITFEHEGGQREELGPGSFMYMPSKMIHQAWT
jgi:mannose-6-phosphate isomerase-like protein (cupin superfamily)